MAERSSHLFRRTEERTIPPLTLPPTRKDTWRQFNELNVAHEKVSKFRITL
jgi:hypothetical protein